MSFKKLHEHLAHGDIVITPNQRLSEHVLTSYLKQHQSLSKPLCFSYTAFLAYCFKGYRHTHASKHLPNILTPAQTQFLWHKVVFDEDTPETLINAIKDAWVICENWGVSYEHPAFQETEQTQVFASYCMKFKQELQARKAITEQELTGYLSKHMEAFKHAHLIWLSFDELTPRQHHLAQHLSTLGVTHMHAELEAHQAQSFQVVTEHKLDEYRTCFHWARQQLKQGCKSIGIIVPDLHADRALIERVLAYEHEKTPLNISLGKRLTHYPMIAHALQFLQLNTNLLDHTTVQLLLSSPYIHAEDETYSKRQQCFASNPIFTERQISMRSLKYAIREDLPVLCQCLENLSSYPKSATPEAWAQLFIARLNTLGFPGDASLSSEQHQCLERFMRLLETWTSLAYISESLTRKQALASLGTLAAQTVFQAEQADTPIQVVGLLESASLNFDAIWVCQATADTLPHKTRLNPFIPISLQKSLHMPYVDALKEYQLAQKQVQRFQHSCKTLVFSYANNAEESQSLPSPLIESFDVLQTTAQTQTNSACQAEAENYHLPWTAKDEQKGGTRRLEDQAHCAFKAFAAHRLHACDHPQVNDGLPLSLRGSLLHAVLEYVWREFDSLKALKQTPEQALEHIVHTAIEQALKPVKYLAPHSLNPLVAEVEYERLHHLVKQALAWELDRENFNIHKLEQTYELTLGRLKFRVRIDRMDELESGKRLVIDYKSRIPSPLPFDEETPEHPQLLVYAFTDDRVHALCYLAPQNESFVCRGVSGDDIDIKGMHEVEWASYEAAWHASLLSLSEAFYAGNVAPRPLKPSTCQQCGFQSLCRI